MDEQALQKVKADCFDKMIGDEIDIGELGRLIAYFCGVTDIQTVFGYGEAGDPNSVGYSLSFLERDVQLEILRPIFAEILGSHIGGDVTINWANQQTAS